MIARFCTRREFSLTSSVVAQQKFSQAATRIYMNANSIKHNLLHEIEIFRDLTRAEVEKLGRLMPLKRVRAGTIFYEPQKYSQEILFLIKQGRVRLFHLSADGKTFTTAMLEAGTFFGEMLLVGQRLDGNYAEAATSCLICPISLQNVVDYFLTDRRIAFRIMETLGRRLFDAEQRLADFAFKQIPARLASLLLQTAAKNQAASNAARAPLLPVVALTHEELAQMLGAHRETVTRVLNEMRQANIIELRRGQITLLDLEKLKIIGQNDSAGF